jgi:hypothetical protein
MIAGDQFDVWKARHDALLRYYMALREIVVEITGYDIIPDELAEPVTHSKEISADDRAWLKQLGIEPDQETL